MSYYFKPDKALEDRAVEKLRKLLFQKPFMERWEPVQTETQWVITGRPNPRLHKMILPKYCYNILELHKRTIYKTFSPISEVVSFKNKNRALKCKTVADAKKEMTIEWEKLGKVFSMGERCQMFFEHQMESEIKKAISLKRNKKREAEFFEMMFGDPWIEKKLAEIQAREPGKPVEEILEKNLAALEEKTKKAVPDWHDKAREWEPGAVRKFHAGVAKGSEDFLNNKGELQGEGKLKLKETYQFLLIFWPEIEEMLKAKPSKTRNQLWGLVEALQLRQMDRD